MEYMDKTGLAIGIIFLFTGIVLTYIGANYEKFNLYEEIGNKALFVGVILSFISILLIIKVVKESLEYYTLV